MRAFWVAPILATLVTPALAQVSCRTSDSGETRCSDGTIYRVERGGTIRDNRGRAWRFEDAGVNRGGDYRAYGQGLWQDYRDRDGRPEIDQPMRGPNGAACRLNDEGLTRCD